MFLLVRLRACMCVCASVWVCLRARSPSMRCFRSSTATTVLCAQPAGRFKSTVENRVYISQRAPQEMCASVCRQNDRGGSVSCKTSLLFTLYLSLSPPPSRRQCKMSLVVGVGGGGGLTCAYTAAVWWYARACVQVCVCGWVFWVARPLAGGQRFSFLAHTKSCSCVVGVVAAVVCC